MIAALTITAALLNPAPPTPDNLGPWEALAGCESGYAENAWTIQNPHSTASGRFQFLDTTWQWVTADMNRPDLTRLGRAMYATPADQLAAAEHLRTMPGGGLQHWECTGYGQTPKHPAPPVFHTTRQPELWAYWPATVL